MSEESICGRWGTVRTVAVVVSATITLLAFILGSGFVYNEWYNVPDVRYTVLPSYKFESLSFGGLLVENRGRATAHQVLIKTGDLGTNIYNYTAESDERWSVASGGIEEPNLALWLDRMASGSSITVYFLTSNPGSFDSVVVTTEEGPGHQAMADSSNSLLAVFGVWCVMMLILALSARIIYVAIFR